MSTTKLVALFRTEDGKDQRWTYDAPDTSKTPAEIKTALEELTKLNLFQKHGVRQFAEIQNAEFVTTNETSIF